MNYHTRPLTREAKARLKGIQRQHSRFDTGWGVTLYELDREVGYLRPKYREFVLQIDVEERDLRLDGELRANARPASPDVAIAVDTRSKGSLLFVCGRFLYWQDNVRAIALGLEALRKVERYGIVQSDEQYKGFGQLPPGTPMPAAKMTLDEARKLLVNASGSDLATNATWGDVYRSAARQHHPDAGGDNDYFVQINAAYQLIRSEVAMP